jgi:tetratricopeptide (TPR) repeat protein
MLSARADLQAGDRSAAEQHLRRVIELEPSNLGAYELLGRNYIDQRRLDEAQREFEALLAVNPRSVGAQTVVGMLLHSQSKVDEAAKAYEKALQIDPSAAVAANNLANIYADRNQNLDEALKLAQVAAEKLPEEPAVTDTVGWVYYKKQLPALAVPQFEKCVLKSPNNPMFHYHLGLAYALAGETAKARASLEQSLRLNPSFEGAADAKQKLASLKG